MTATTAPVAATPRSPYRGLEPFRYVDRRIFFARIEESRQLLRYVTMYRGVLLYGDSGVGKSSLINARFISEAIEAGFTPERIRVQPRQGEEIVVERIQATAEPGPPFLPSHFASADATESRIVLSIDKFRERLGRKATLGVPLLVFDQFEEWVTLFEETPRSGSFAAAHDTQDKILDCIVQCLRQVELPVKLLFVFREDYLAKLNRLFVRYPDLRDQYLRLMPPRVDALDSIIRGPFLPPNQDLFAKQFSPALAAKLTSAIKGRGDAVYINLSEVQVVCQTLWEAQDPEALLAKVGVEGLLQDYLAGSIVRLRKDLQPAAIALLVRLVTRNGTRNVVLEDDLIRLARDEEKFTQATLTQALTVLVTETRLVRRELRNNAYFYEIVSESLVPWILRQKGLRAASRERSALLKKAVAISGAVVLVVGSLAGWVYYDRTQRALRDGLVKEAVAREESAVRERDQTISRLGILYGRVTALEGVIAGESGTAVQDLVKQQAKERSAYSAEGERLNREVERLNREVIERTKHEEELTSKLNDLSSAASAKEKELTARIEALQKPNAAPEVAAQTKPTAAGTVLQNFRVLQNSATLLRVPPFVEKIGIAIGDADDDGTWTYVYPARLRVPQGASNDALKALMRGNCLAHGLLVEKKNVKKKGTQLTLEFTSETTTFVVSMLDAGTVVGRNYVVFDITAGPARAVTQSPCS